MTGNPTVQDEKLKERVAQLWRAGQGGAWEEIVAAARELRVDYPLEPLGYIRGTFALRQLRRFDEADAVILDAILLFPENPEPLIEAAWVAQRRGDNRSALRRSAVLIERFPTQAPGYLLQAYANRCIGEFLDAERILGQGMQRFPAALEFKAEACWLALAQGRWELAAERCAALRASQPTAQVGYQVAVAALRNLSRWSEVGEVLAGASEHLGAQDWILLESLRLAQQLEGPERVVELAEQIAARSPSDATAYHVGAAAYRQLGRSVDAEKLLERAIAQIPPNVHVLSEYAFAAQDRGDWVLADQRWTEAMLRFPDEPSVVLWHARLPVAGGRALRRDDVTEAHRRMLQVHERFPELRAAYADHIRMFRTANRLDDAEEIARLACSRMPADLQIRLEFSQVAADRGRPQEALERLQEVEPRFRDDVGFQCRRVAAMAAADRIDEAEAACLGLLARYDGTVQPHVEYAELAMRRHDWKAAIERWQAIDARFPGLTWVKKRLFDAQLGTTEDGGSAGAATVAPPANARPEEVAMETIAAFFESLAGTFQGCEFGRVQRHYGCEPLGLFRWAQIDIEDLIRAIECRFDGTGTAEQTELLLFDNDEDRFNEHTAEYQVGDKRYRMRMHTFVRRDEMAFDKMFSQSTRRLQFLKRKLLEDLAEAQKIFVYKRGHAPLCPRDAQRLSQALQTHSPDNELLCVHLSTSDRPAGTVERITPRLLFGYVSHFSLARGGNIRVPAYDEWASVCRQAYSLWSNARMARQPAIEA